MDLYIKYNGKNLFCKELGYYKLRVFTEDISDILKFQYQLDTCVLFDIEFFSKQQIGKYKMAKVCEMKLTDGCVDLIYTRKKFSEITEIDKIKLL